jgi:hypothetical protein
MFVKPSAIRTTTTAIANAERPHTSHVLSFVDEEIGTSDGFADYRPTRHLAGRRESSYPVVSVATIAKSLKTLMLKDRWTAEIFWAVHNASASSTLWIERAGGLATRVVAT